MAGLTVLLELDIAAKRRRGRSINYISKSTMNDTNRSMSFSNIHRIIQKHRYDSTHSRYPRVPLMPRRLAFDECDPPKKIPRRNPEQTEARNQSSLRQDVKLVAMDNAVGLTPQDNEANQNEVRRHVHRNSGDGTRLCRCSSAPAVDYGLPNAYRYNFRASTQRRHETDVARGIRRKRR